jgi:putative transposase
MWTKELRRIYRREGDDYPSDLQDVEWARLAPLIPPAPPGGRPRKTDMRAAMNAILYLLRTGWPWRYLPRDSFPPRSTVYNIFRKFQRDGTWEAISAELHMALRERMGREATPLRRCSTASRSNRPKRGRQRQPSGLRRRQAGEGP